MAKYKSTAELAGPRYSRPAFPLQDERGFVLPLLREAGPAGIYRLHFLHGSGPCNGRLVTQVGRLINALESEGYIFKHERREGFPFIFYVLVSEPAEPGVKSDRKPRNWRSLLEQVANGYTTTSTTVGQQLRNISMAAAVPQQSMFETNQAYETGRIQKDKR